MKNILVVLVLLVVSQVLTAITQDVDPALNGPNDCGELREPPIKTIFLSADRVDDNKCGKYLNPEKQKEIVNKEQASFEESGEPRLCCGREEEKSDRNRQGKKHK